MYGKREFKYDFLYNNPIKTIDYKQLPNLGPNYLFVNKNFDAKIEYDLGFAVNELFTINSVGIVSANDMLYIAFDQESLEKQIIDKYDTIDKQIIRPIAYRPFYVRFLYNNINLIARSRTKVMQHFLNGENLGLVFEKIMTNKNFDYIDIFISKNIIDGHTIGSASYLFPLYLYPQTNAQQSLFKPISKNKLDVLNKNFDYVKKHFNQVSDFFNKTVLPFYNSLPNPDSAQTILFEENRSTYEEAKATFESLKTQLDEANKQGLENTFVLNQDERTPNLNTEIVKQIANKLNVTFTNKIRNNQRYFCANRRFRLHLCGFA